MVIVRDTSNVAIGVKCAPENEFGKYVWRGGAAWTRCSTRSMLLILVKDN